MTGLTFVEFLLIILLLLAVCGYFILGCETRTYNELTGENVTKTQYLMHGAQLKKKLGQEYRVEMKE